MKRLKKEFQSAVRIQMPELEDLIKNTDVNIEILTDEDVSKTHYALYKLVSMSTAIKDYEWSQNQMVNGMSAFDQMNAEGYARAGEHGREEYSDVSSSTVILKYKSRAIYLFYKAMVQVLHTVITNVKDPHESLIAKLLFIDYMPNTKACNYLGRGYRRDIYAISRTTFYAKKFSATKDIAGQLLPLGVLDLIVKDERLKDGYKFVLSGWTDE